MANKILLQTLLRFSDDIKSGAAKVQDVVTDYFNQTGKSVTNEERGIILKEFQDNAPSNVTTIEGVDPVETIMPMGGVEKGEGSVKFGKLDYDLLRKQNPGVEIRGDESFDELVEKFKSEKQGLGSLFPKGRPGSIFDLKNDKRMEVAQFMRAMRAAGIKNEDVMDIAKITDVEQGKRAATTKARAVEMGADTKVKQELLSELDEMKMDNSPRYFNEDYMGFDDFRSATDAKKIEVNNAIVDDLEAMGVADEDVMRIMGKARELNKNNFFITGEEFIDVIKQELEFNDINYDVEFYKNYFKELTRLMRKPESRFADGGLV